MYSIKSDENICALGRKRPRGGVKEGTMRVVGKLLAQGRLDNLNKLREDFTLKLRN